MPGVSEDHADPQVRIMFKSFKGVLQLPQHLRRKAVAFLTSVDTDQEN